MPLDAAYTVSPGSDCAKGQGGWTPIPISMTPDIFKVNPTSGTAHGVRLEISVSRCTMDVEDSHIPQILWYQDFKRFITPMRATLQ